MQFCVITGGSSGLGRAIACQLLKKGANICIIARNKEQLSETVEYLTSEKIFEGQIIEAISADVTNFQNIKAAVKEMELKHKKIDVLFSCAGNNIIRFHNIRIILGSSKPGFFLNQDVEDFKSGINLNYLGTLHAIKVNEALLFIILIRH